MNRAVIHSSVAGGWQSFEHPLEIVVAPSVENVLPALRHIEQQVTRNRLYAAGFIAYEAAPAFDPALAVKDDRSGFPLLWFGLYRKPAALTKLPAPTPPLRAPRLRWTSTVTRDDYQAALSRLRQFLHQGDTYQVNYTFRIQSPLDDDPWSFFCDLVHLEKVPYAAFIDTGRFAVCSASPELFFSLNGSRLVSRPMKGTAPRGRTPAEDETLAEGLRTSPKNRAENVMIVDMIRNDMGRIAAVGTVNPTPLFTLERYPTAWQMTSTVTADTQASVGEILTALFPCASITGAPKPRTMSIIAELETTPRRIYTGAIGFLAPDRQAEFNVAIRTVLIDKPAHLAEYGTGGGIVWDSTSREEYDECWTKARIVTDEHPDFQLLETILWTPDDGFFLLKRHLDRLSASAGYFDVPVSLAAVEASLLKWAGSAPRQPFRLRLLVSRTGSITLQADAMNAFGNQPVRLRLAPSPIDPTDRFLFHKTTRRQVYEQARKACGDCDDALLWNPAGELTESTIANLVVDLDGARVTPPVACGLLAGTFRAALLAEGRIQERVVYRSDLARCQRLFLINSVRQWREGMLIE